MIAHEIKAALPREDIVNHTVRIAVGIAGLLRAMHQAAHERAQLLSLSDRDLRDIGITRVDAVRAAEQPLWRFSDPPADDKVAFYRRRGETLRVRAIGDWAAALRRRVVGLLS
jgi:uncharacterized protein YjiS (DUF1127 family)